MAGDASRGTRVPSPRFGAMGPLCGHLFGKPEGKLPTPHGKVGAQIQARASARWKMTFGGGFDLETKRLRRLPVKFVNPNGQRAGRLAYLHGDGYLSKWHLAPARLSPHPDCKDAGPFGVNVRPKMLSKGHRAR